MTERRELEGLGGQILRAWREYAGRSAAEVARVMGFARSAIVMWEKGDRGRRQAEFVNTVKDYGRALDLSPHEVDALVGLWQAAGTPRIAHARADWAHNYDAQYGPVWAWVRTRSKHDQFAGAAQWGPFQTRFDASASGNGLIIQAPTSAPNPPFTITLTEPGWSDFGEGHVPEQVASRLGITYLRLGTFVGPKTVWTATDWLSDSDHRYLQPTILETAHLATRLGMRWVFGQNRSSRHALDGGEVEATAPPGAKVSDELGLLSQLLVLPATAQEIREARGMSRAEAARRSTEYEPRIPVTTNMIEELEYNGRIPSPPRTLTRLDMVYHADGRFGVDRTFHSSTHGASSDGTHAITFARYWRGPVWIQTRHDDPLAVCTVELTWGPWRRRQRIQANGVLTTRKATTDAPPLRVRVPPGWHVVAGLGAIPTALDINQGWYPHDIVGAISLIREGVRSVRRALTSAGSNDATEER